MQVFEVLIFVAGMVCGGLLLVAFRRWLPRARGRHEQVRAEVRRDLQGEELRLTEFQSRLAEFEQAVGAQRTALEPVRQRLQALLGETAEAGRITAAEMALLEDHLQAALAAQQQASTLGSAVLEHGQQLAVCVEEARTDPLTRIPNRRGFDEELARRLAQWDRHHVAFSLLLIDVDCLKAWNDKHGHLAGDDVLRQVAGRLQGAIRQADFVCRLGGDEFAILLPNQEPREAALAAERLQQLFEHASPVYAGQALPVTISGGLATVQPGESAETLLARADAAMYASKRGGSNRVHWHTEGAPQPLGTQTRPAKTTPDS